MTREEHHFLRGERESNDEASSTIFLIQGTTKNLCILSDIKIEMVKPKVKISN